MMFFLKQKSGSLLQKVGVLLFAFSMTAFPARAEAISRTDDAIMVSGGGALPTAAVASGVGLLVPHAAAAHDRSLYQLSVSGAPSPRGKGGWKYANGRIGEVVVKDWLNRPSSGSRWLYLKPPPMNKNVKALLPDSASRMGLDAIYIKVDAFYKPRGLMVDEVKFGTSQPSTDKFGCMQTDACYIDPRLKETARFYRDTVAVSIEEKGVTVVPEGRVPPDASRIGIGNKGIVSFWYDSTERRWVMADAAGVSPEDLSQALRNCAKFIERMADLPSSYRSRLINVSVADERNFKIQFSDGIAHGVSAKPESENSILVKFSDLRPAFKNVILGEIKTAMTDEMTRLNPKISPEHIAIKVNNLVDEAKKSGTVPKLAARFNSSVATDYDINPFLIRSAVAGGSLGGLTAALVEILEVPVFGMDFNGGHLAQTALLGSLSGAAGSYAGARFAVWTMQDELLARPILGRPLTSPPKTATLKIMKQLGGGVVGGTVAGLVFSYGSYLMGNGDLIDANRNMSAGLVGVAAGTATSMATLGLVTAYGTASTGTAIATLHGIVATKAALAWLGGGSIASGGFGVAGGALVVGGVVTIVAVGASTVVSLAYAVWDAGVEDRRVTDLVHCVEKYVAQAKSPMALDL